ncbi:hypothetical protein [Nonomuraea angiospora]|uniref:hypothetical protein n=1 Tax=Nonomuraea angiospora TaxID=46172 RepID=UPI0029B31CA5|nr:hypothetical protein [Nonomuraea angiospora]MDX3101746.1 hypothetical protein [Nonomuraea angiospora]
MAIIEGAQPRPGKVRVLAANAAPVLARDDAVVSLASTDATSRGVTMTATQAGHVVTVCLRQRSSTGVYTLAVSGGTITLDAVGEGCVVAYDGSAWQMAALTGGATFA